MAVFISKKGDDMLKLKKIAMLTVAVATLGIGANMAAAATANPAPYPIIDQWNYGTKANGVTEYSHYYVKTDNYGSIAKLQSKNWPNEILKSDKQNYGMSSAEKDRAWNDKKGMTKLWDYYKF